jgi:peptidoglycan/LPS O-acetylase OafA/YrhL
LLKGAGWITENFPDDPRLGSRLLIIGAVLCLALIIPTGFAADGDFHWLLFLKFLCLICGIICLVLAGLVFFRRAVWWRQEKAASGLTSLDLSERNNSSPSRVSRKEADEYIFGDSPD